MVTVEADEGLFSLIRDRVRDLIQNLDVDSPVTLGARHEVDKSIKQAQQQVTKIRFKLIKSQAKVKVLEAELQKYKAIVNNHQMRLEVINEVVPSPKRQRGLLYNSDNE